MRRGILLLLAIILPQTANSQNPVVMTESAVTLGRGNLRTGFGFEYLAKTIAPEPDAPRSLFRAFNGISAGGSKLELSERLCILDETSNKSTARKNHR